MDFKVGDYVVAVDVEVESHRKNLLKLNHAYKIESTAIATDTVKLEDQPFNWYCGRFISIDVKSLTKLEKAIYSIKS